eukprot:Platyproteum_vivax@DN4918_c0_g1_i1.p1
MELRRPNRFPGVIRSYFTKPVDFDDPKDPNRALLKCTCLVVKDDSKACGVTVSATSTSNLKHHMVRWHPEHEWTQAFFNQQAALKPSDVMSKSSPPQAVYRRMVHGFPVFQADTQYEYNQSDYPSNKRLRVDPTVHPMVPMVHPVVDQYQAEDYRMPTVEPPPPNTAIMVVDATVMCITSLEEFDVHTQFGPDYFVLVQNNNYWCFVPLKDGSFYPMTGNKYVLQRKPKPNTYMDSCPSSYF